MHLEGKGSHKTLPEYFPNATDKRKKPSKIKSLRGPALCGWKAKVRKSTWGFLLLQASLFEDCNVYLTQ